MNLEEAAVLKCLGKEDEPIKKERFTPQEDCFIVAHYKDCYEKMPLLLIQMREHFGSTARNTLSLSNRKSKLIKDGKWTKIEKLILKYGEDAPKHYYEIELDEVKTKIATRSVCDSCVATDMCYLKKEIAEKLKSIQMSGVAFGLTSCEKYR